MHRVVRIGSVVLAALALLAPLAWAEDMVAVGKKGEVELTRTTHVGSTVLKPGHYQFQHQLADGQHYLVVRIQETRRGPTMSGHYAGKTGDEVARVSCRLVSTEKGQRANTLYLTQKADGTSTLTRLDIRGEKGGHVLVLEPQS